jgi:hypothetical protein
MVNFLEQLVAEWYEFNGYFVRRNVRVSRRERGGYEGELDIVAFHPERRRLVHIEPSMDAHSWATREKRYRKKFEAGKRHIPSLFTGFDLPSDIEQIAILIQGARQEISGGRVLLVADLMKEICSTLRTRPVLKQAVPEQYQLLRALQFAANYWELADSDRHTEKVARRAD